MICLARTHTRPRIARAGTTAVARRLALATELAAALALCIAPWQGASAQADYPNHAIRIIEPHTPGGLVDTFARYVAQELGKKFGQPVVIDNRPGANQAIAAETAAKAAPDGYTLLVGTQVGLVFNPIAKKNVPFDPVRDFAPITGLFTTPFYLVVNPKVPVKNVAELIAYAKANPGKLTFASLGQGSAQHLAGEIFKTMTKTDMLHVAYKGSAPASADLLGGQVDLMFEGGTSTLPYVRTGKLRALGATGTAHTEEMPDLPTIGETVPSYDLTVWIGLVAPAGTPRPIIDKLNREVTAILRRPETHEKFRNVGVEVMPTTPEALATRIKTEVPEWTKVMRDAGIQPE
jgi:tripartite-type tricarboxylate transporter receptor subunit TctC